MADPGFFATTRWTLVSQAGGGNGTQAQRALDSLFAAYWQPLYRYARRKGNSREDAEDLVQGFMIHLLEGRALRHLDRSKGRFRTFLLTSFQYWMVNEWKRATRLKRGGGVPGLSLDWAGAETGLRLEIADHRSPDRLYDREWALTLLEKVLRDLEAAASAEEDGVPFSRLKPCLTADSTRIPYAKLAAEFWLGEGALRVAVHRLRKRYRSLLCAEIARTLSSPEAVEEEMKTLLSVLAG